MARRKKLSPDPFELHIDTLLASGRGAAVFEGRSLEVHGALPGESVLARYLFGRRMRGQAETLEVLQPSGDRVEPRCPHFGVCSACSLQHLAPTAQIAFKQHVLLSCLEGQGVHAERILAPLQADLWHYRRKARLSVRHVAGKGRVLVGFRERDGRFVADMNECHVLPESVASQLPALSGLIGDLEGVRSIPQIEVTCGDDGCALIFRHLEPLSEPDADRLREFARSTGLAVLLQPKGPDSVMALEPAVPELRYRLPEFGLEFRFESQDFVQVNASINGLMIRQALELLALQANERVLELFCGLGNFSLPLARQCAAVTAVEGDAGLVSRAQDNARANEVHNVEFLHCDLYGEDPAASLPAGPFDKVLLDPPRSGASKVLDLISVSGASRVVYVSCNPTTLAEDSARLVRTHGFELAAAGVMDMFPHTAHVESMALFVRN